MKKKIGMVTTSIDILHETNFISLKRANYSNPKGRQLTWDYISRKANQRVVSIVAQNPLSRKVLLIKQFRVPISKWVIEFPKGLIENGESAEVAAKRELKEETGYEGSVTRIHQLLSANPYLTDEYTILAEMVIEDQIPGQTDLEDTEEICSFWINREEFKETFLAKDEKNCSYIIETPVVTFFMEAK
jgi:ADP-ribose pyrophosphatase